MTYSKIKAEIFKLSTLSKFRKESNSNELTEEKSKPMNDELGYFNNLDSI